MKRMKKWLGSLAILLALVAGLVIWTMLPWPGVLAVAPLSTNLIDEHWSFPTRFSTPVDGGRERRGRLLRDRAAPS